MTRAPTLQIALGLTLVLAAIIAFETLTPPGEGDNLLPLTDKQMHAMAFAALVFPLGWVRPDRALWLIPAALIYGAMIEVIQPAVGRSGEWADLAADAVGILAGLLPGQIRHRVAMRRARR